MKKLIIGILLTFSITVNLFAQTDDKQNAWAVIEKMFAEMANHNPTAIAELFTKEASLAAIIKTKDGKSVVRYFSGEAFSKNFAEKKNEIKEDMYERKVEVDGDFALVWGRYVFFVDGKTSHCGVNSFNLVRTEAGWRIANAASTIDPNGCTEAEKARRE